MSGDDIEITHEVVNADNKLESQRKGNNKNRHKRQRQGSSNEQTQGHRPPINNWTPPSVPTPSQSQPTFEGQNNVQPFQTWPPGYDGNLANWNQMYPQQATASNFQGGVPTVPFGPFNPGDPSSFNMPFFAPFPMPGFVPPIPNELYNGPVSKPPLTFSNCILFPPNPNAPEPSRREKPEGCRTIFVGGVPETITEDIVQEVFSHVGGPITSIRISKKHFCHVRFESENSVENSLKLSGYRMRIGNKSDPSNTGKIHVDYALARDDQYENECRMREERRNQRHRERREVESWERETNSPILAFDDEPAHLEVTHFTEHEAHTMIDEIKRDDRFDKSVEKLIIWLERGECSKRNSAQFYTLIQSTYAHSRKLLAEKQNYDLEMDKIKLQLNAKLQTFLLTFGQIERVFLSASRQKAWDQFSKAQRKNMTQWKTQLEELRKQYVDQREPPKSECEAMDLSDEDQSRDGTDKNDESQIVETFKSAKRLKFAGPEQEEANSVREELDSLRSDFESFRAVKELEIEAKENQILVMQKSIHELEQKLLEAQNLESTSVNTVDSHNKLESDSRILSLLSIYLHANPLGCNLTSLQSYMEKYVASITEKDIVRLLESNPNIFNKRKTDLSDLETEWTFVAYKENM